MKNRFFKAIQTDVIGGGNGDAGREFLHGVLSWRQWGGLGLLDIRMRYKRTLLGPWWITASQAALFTCIGLLYSAVLQNDINSYLPYLAGGLVTWTFISAMATEGPQIFLEHQQVIGSLRIPLIVHVLRSAVRNLIVFLHNFSAALAAHLLLGGEITTAGLMLLASLPILFVTLSAGGLILAIVGVRFRDLGPIIAIATQLGFFLTPIIWHTNDIPQASKWWVTINPAYHMVEMVRAPLLGMMPSSLSIWFSALFALALAGCAYLLYRAVQHRVVYWL